MKYLLIIILISFFSLNSETIWQDDFETAGDWILSGEFEIDPPQGLGGNYGNPDPAAAYSGSNVLGTDLNGTGSYPGDYEPNLAEHEYAAISPSIDCSEFVNVEFSFMKWLNVEQPAYDHAYISISNDDGISWVDIWTNNATISDNAWSLETYDISSLADMKSNLRIRFSIGPTDGSWQYSGWNIDDVIVSGDPVVYGAIEGHVVNIDTTIPISYAQVLCPFSFALTDESGYFLLTDIPAGDRFISINAIGYYTYYSQAITVIENDTTYVLCEILENPDTPPAPVNLQAEVLDNSQVHLWWDEPPVDEILLAYNIYRNSFMIASSLSTEFLDELFVSGTYEYFVTAVYDVGESLPSNIVEVQIEEVGISGELVSNNIKLWNYPNPFNPNTTISMNISNEQNEQIELVIYNQKGQQVRTLVPSLCHPELVEGRGRKNKYFVIWNGKDDSGKPVSSGVYLYRLKFGDLEKTQRMLLLK